MYFARFDLAGASFQAAGFFAGADPHGLVPVAWRARLLAAETCGFALRLVFHGGKQAATHLLLNAPGDEMRALTDLARHLAETAHAAEGARAAESVEEFDALTGGVPPCQLWLNHHGYEFDGQPLATGFRVLPLLDHLAGSCNGSLLYQCNLEAYHLRRDEERAIRKFIVGLQFESKMPAVVRDLQSAMASRLLAPAFLCDELLAVDDDSVAGVKDAVERHFEDTAGRLGFRASPLEVGTYDELLVSGLHSSRLLGPGHFLTKAAGALAADEVKRLLDLPLAVGPRVPALLGRAAPVFLSYSSSEFTQALRVCEFLESAGIRCWLAPRNILPGESYPDAILRAIQAARVLVVLVSLASNVSPHVHREIERGLHNRCSIIPMRVQDVKPTGAMEYLLSTCQWVDAAADHFAPALDNIRDRVRTVLNA